jgi:hypothetical protein
LKPHGYAAGSRHTTMGYGNSVEPRRIVAISRAIGDGVHRIDVIADDGTAWWRRSNGKWEQHPPLPEREVP